MKIPELVLNKLLLNLMISSSLQVVNWNFLDNKCFFSYKGSQKKNCKRKTVTKTSDSSYCVFKLNGRKKIGILKYIVEVENEIFGILEDYALFDKKALFYKISTNIVV